MIEPLRKVGVPTVLIVDDEPANVQVLGEALSDECDVRFTTRADDAVMLAARFGVDLILLDLVMPDRSGFEVLAALKADPACRDIPVIIVTAMSDLLDEEAGLSAGAVDYITKPINPSIVRARVRTHVELKRQRDQLSALADLDGLTGIANRRRFDQQLDLRWRQASRSQGRLALVIADVDHFKQYNDHFGHGPGDQCLRAVAAALSSAASRADDLVARYGGEEFALILTADGLEQQLAGLLRAVATLSLPHPRSTAGDFVSLSLGAVEVSPMPGYGPDHGLSAADALLYAAKNGGRNRGVFRRFDGSQALIVNPGEFNNGKAH
jgi:diguanylate cyclase (GGDEF)-like protein